MTHQDTTQELQNINDSLLLILQRMQAIEESSANTDINVGFVERVYASSLLRLQAIEESTANMDRHIGFVERVYARIKQPFHYIMNMVSTNAISVPVIPTTVHKGCIGAPPVCI
jgi:hypothetical protein